MADRCSLLESLGFITANNTPLPWLSASKYPSDKAELGLSRFCTLSRDEASSPPLLFFFETHFTRISLERHLYPNSALRLIGALTTLQQIHLSIGNQFGRSRDWQINQKSMKRHLRNLASLKKLAFSRDSYKTEFSSRSIEYYYDDKFFAEADPEDRNERNSVWERKHRTRMLTEANAYVQRLPQLEWIYFGQIPMGFTEPTGTQGKVVVALCKERNDCCTFLREMFRVKV